MAISTRKVAETFVNIQVGVNINCNWPLYDDDEVACIYGKNSLKAIKNTDYAVQLAPPNYATFVVVPLQSWLDKINALIAADVTETNYTTIRRKTDVLTDVTDANVDDTTYLKREIERLWANLQELDERMAGAATLEDRYIGNVDGPITIAMPIAGRAIIGKADASGYEAGPNAADIAGAQGYASAAAASAAAAATTASGIGLTATSSSNVSVGTGSKSFTVPAGKSWIVGQRLRAATSDLSKVMDGEITAYSSTTLTIDVDYTEGSGSSSSWNIGVIGARGATGATGATGPAGPGSGDMQASTYDAATIAQQVVGVSATQTVTNKTINSSTIGNTSVVRGYRDANSVAGTSYTLVLTDGGKCVLTTSGSAVSLTVPHNSTVGYPVGTEIDIAQLGAGQVTIVAAGSVTIRSKNSYLKLTGIYSGATLKKINTNEWILVGDLAA